jgi:hypothetical protein
MKDDENRLVGQFQYINDVIVPADTVQYTGIFYY